jgi:outer membrane protein TolC
MRLPVTLFLALLGCACLRAEAPPIDGTLPEDYLPGLRPLLKTAVERSPNTILASISLAQQEAAKIAAYAELYPSAGLNLNYASNTEKASDSANSTSKGLFYSASINQPVFQWGAYKNTARIGDLGVKIAQRQYAEAYRLLAASIREQYMGLVGKKVLLRNAKFAQKLSEETLAAEQAKFDSGSSSQAQLGTYKLNLEQARLDADRAQEDYGYTKRVFTRLVGVEDLDDASVPLMVPHPEYPAAKADAILAGFVGDGIESTFQNQVYQMTIKQQDLNYDIQRVRLLPKVLASASYSYQNSTNASVGSVSQVGIQSEAYSVAANWTIFDGFATKAAKLSALETKHYYERIKKNYVDSTIDQVTYLRHQLDFSARGMSLAEVHNALIEADVRRLGDDRKLGYASQASIDAGVQTLNATEYQQSYARSDYLSRWTDFVSLAGVDPIMSNISPRYAR